MTMSVTQAARIYFNTNLDERVPATVLAKFVSEILKKDMSPRRLNQEMHVKPHKSNGVMKYSRIEVFN